jgi:transcription termination/antitermination protein NusG
MAAACTRKCYMLVHPECSWYAIHVKYQSEKTVAAMLDWKGYETCSPIYFAERRWSDRIKVLQLPLFPGYIFCRMLARACGLLVSTPGVIGVVSFGGQPFPVTDAEIDAIKKVSIWGNP